MIVNNVRLYWSTGSRTIYTASKLLEESNRLRTMKCLEKPLSRGGGKHASDKLAAVLIALCTNTNTDELSLLYTKRSATLSRHSSQISFPGGLHDEADTDAIACALRECEEEIGLTEDQIELWGAGGCIQNPRSANIIPVVGVVRDINTSKLTLNEHEVAAAFTVPIQELVDNLSHTQFRIGYSVPLFLTKPYRVWGLTAYMTFNFLNCLIPTDANWQNAKKKVKYIKPMKFKST